jgi:hypothetical protein
MLCSVVLLPILFLDVALRLEPICQRSLFFSLAAFQSLFDDR